MDMIKSCIGFGDLDLIFKVTASYLKLPSSTGLEGGGHLFSLKTLLYLFKINSFLAFSRGSPAFASPYD